MPNRNSSPDKPRTYLVLEELDIADLVKRLAGDVNPDALTVVVNAIVSAPELDRRVYHLLSEQQAHNAHAARRQAGRVYEDAVGPTPEHLVSVPVKNWQPGPVSRLSKLTVG